MKVLFPLSNVRLKSFVKFVPIQAIILAAGVNLILTLHRQQGCLSLNVQFPEVFSSLKERFEAFVAAGSNKKSRKEFDNVIHPTSINMDDSALILDVIPPMELRLLIGIVNQLFKNFTDVWLFLPKNGQLYCIFSSSHINVDTFKTLVVKNCTYHGFGFIETFRQFKAVVSSCFGKALKRDFKRKKSELQNLFSLLADFSYTKCS